MTCHLRVSVATHSLHVLVQESHTGFVSFARRILSSPLHKRGPNTVPQSDVHCLEGNINPDNVVAMLGNIFTIPEFISRQPFSHVHVELGFAHAHSGILQRVSKEYSSPREFESYRNAWVANRWPLGKIPPRLNSTKVDKNNSLVTASSALLCTALDNFFTDRKIPLKTCLPSLIPFIFAYQFPVKGEACTVLLLREQTGRFAEPTVQMALMGPTGPQEIATCRINDVADNSAVETALRRMVCGSGIQIAPRVVEYVWPGPH